MFRLLLLCVLALPAKAHEFWIAPQSLQPALSEAIEPQVLIGERLEGQVHPFQPRAYQQALWLGPERAEALHVRRILDGPPQLRATKEGMHILAVATFPMVYVHPTGDAFRQYAETEVRSVHAASDLRLGPVRETYRRFSKTLIQIGAGLAQDRRVGLEYEWVRSAERFTLFQAGAPLARQSARLTCRAVDGEVLERELVTNDRGVVTVDVKGALECLLNAVLLEKREDTWDSAWVSIYF